MDDSSTVDFKFVEPYLKDKFLRPFARRLKFIYLGLDRCEDIFVLSETEDIEFKYCDAMQTTGLIKIKNKEHLQKILNWLDSFKIDRTKPCIFYFGVITALLNKLPWSDPTIKVVRDKNGVVTISSETFSNVIIARPVDTYFTLTKLQSFVDKYTKVFFQNEGYYYDVEADLEKTGSVSVISVACLGLYETGVLDVICDDIKLVLLSGLDLLIVKSLIIPEQDYKFGVRLWADNGKKCINYGSFYDDVNISICTSRDNVFIFPIAKKE